MIISDEGNKILESNGIVIKSKKTGEWEVISGGGGGAFATFSVDPLTQKLICDKSFDELYEAIHNGPVSIALYVGPGATTAYSTSAMATAGSKRTIVCTYIVFDSTYVQIAWPEGEDISTTSKGLWFGPDD